MTSPLTPTHDPDICAEMVGAGFAVYRNREGKRWVAKGTCDRKGQCREGASDELLDTVIFPHAPGMRPCCAISFIELPSCAPNTF